MLKVKTVGDIPRIHTDNLRKVPYLPYLTVQKLLLACTEKQGFTISWQLKKWAPKSPRKEDLHVETINPGMRMTNKFNSI